MAGVLMSFVPATSSRDALALIAIAVVAVLAVFLRRVGKGGSDAPSSAAEPGPPADTGTEPSADPLDEDEAGDDPEVVAITSDGWAFMPDGDEVQLVPPPEAPGGDETDPTDTLNPTAMLPHPRHRHLPTAKPGEHLDAGDFIGARVVRGSPGSDPWRLEALGHDGEYRSWAFETPEAADEALRLLLERIVRPPLDPDGTPRPPDAAQYAAAAALTAEGIAELAMDTDENAESPETFESREKFTR